MQSIYSSDKVINYSKNISTSHSYLVDVLLNSYLVIFKLEFKFVLFLLYFSVILIFVTFYKSY